MPFNNQNNLQKMTVVNLKNLLRSQGYSVVGNKNELIDRVITNIGWSSKSTTFIPKTPPGAPPPSSYINYKNQSKK